MRVRRLLLEAFGPFTKRVLDFTPPADGNLFVVVGPNEAGKSSALRALCDLRYGIHARSDDDFVHDKPALCVGGVFVGPDGGLLSLMRRKKNKASLTLHEADDADHSRGLPAPPAVEALLTGALSREDYLQMYALDHARLREGGAALARGEGDIGAALFEASAGVSSVPALLAQLDEQAKAHYSGNRGKTARVAVALADYKAHAEQHRSLLIRPDAWAARQREHTAAREKLDAVRAALKAQRDRQLLVRELRAVEPLRASLRAAQRELAEVGHARLLDAEAAATRVARETELATAQAEAEKLRGRVAGIEAEIAAVALDGPCLQVAPAITRLVALQEHIEASAGEVREAADQERAARDALREAARAIAPGRTPEDLLAHAPTPLQRSELAAWIDEITRAELALQQFGRMAQAGGEETPLPAAPPVELSAALRHALDEVVALKDRLGRLDALPRELQAATRRLQALQAELGLEAGALAQARPLLDPVIDEADTEAQRADTRLAALHERVDRQDRAASACHEELEALKAQGEVPTPKAVAAARQHRDRGWALVRHQLQGSPAAGDELAAFVAGAPALPEAYEQAVREADQQVDAMSRDAQRAARLQSLQAQLHNLHAEGAELTAQVSGLENARQAAAEAWAQRLAAAGLPRLAPAALRQWQGQLQTARAAAEALQALQDEQQDALDKKDTVRQVVLAAVQATGLATLTPQAELPSVERVARQVRDTIDSREKALENARAAADERQRQQAQLAAQQAAAQADLAQAAAALSAALPALLLTPGATPQASAGLARGRLAEFGALDEAQRLLLDASRRLARLRDALQAHGAQAGGVAQALGEAVPEAAALRVFIDRVDARLRAALGARDTLQARQQQLAATRAQLADQEGKAASAQRALATLCTTAGVDQPAELPLAEARSAARRAAALRKTECEGQIAQASSRPIDELETLLAAEDLAALPAEQGSIAAAIAALEARETEALQAEEAARRALEAIDTGDAAAAEREGMEMAAAAVRHHVPAWVRARLAHALLQEATRRFRERAQGPMLQAASAYFSEFTGGDFTGLASDEAETRPTLLGRRASGATVRIDGLSEGTRDQLYLALRLAALELARDGRPEMPVLLDDVLMTSDDVRAGQLIRSLQRFSRGTQVLVFTHHQHLVDVALKAVDGQLGVVQL